MAGQAWQQEQETAGPIAVDREQRDGLGRGDSADFSFVLCPGL